VLQSLSDFISIVHRLEVDCFCDRLHYGFFNDFGTIWALSNNDVRSVMHPSELKNRALVAANEAELSGFTFTAQALLDIAKSCAEEAARFDLQAATESARWSAWGLRELTANAEPKARYHASIPS
jgi:hypothetical protein